MPVAIKESKVNLALTIAVILATCAINYGALSNQVSSLTNEMTRSFLSQGTRIERLEENLRLVHDDQIRMQEQIKGLEQRKK